MRSSYDSKLFEPCSYRTIKIIKTLLELLQYGDVKSFLHKIFSERHRSELMRMLATATCHDSLCSLSWLLLCVRREILTWPYFTTHAPHAQSPRMFWVCSQREICQPPWMPPFMDLLLFLTFVHHIFHIFVLNNSASSYDDISNWSLIICELANFYSLE